jgi:hypothetical protein
MELCRHARSGNFISCSSYFVLVPKPKILFKAGNWIVTNFGIENKEYYIEADRICKKRGDLPEWPLHIVTKRWSDIENFILAFEWALNNHPKVKNPFTDEQLAQCFKETRNEHLWNREFEKFIDREDGNFRFVSGDRLVQLADEFNKTWDGEATA